MFPNCLKFSSNSWISTDIYLLCGTYFVVGSYAVGSYFVVPTSHRKVGSYFVVPTEK